MLSIVVELMLPIIVELMLPIVVELTLPKTVLLQVSSNQWKGTILCSTTAEGGNVTIVFF